MKGVARQLDEIDFQRIAFDDFDVRGHGGAQPRNQVAIDFDGDDAACSGGKFARERAGAGADFDDRVFGADGGKPDDTLEDIAVGEEVLAVALLQKTSRTGFEPVLQP